MSAQNLLNDYGWGVDGLGRAHIHLKDDRVVVFCSMPGQSAVPAVWELIEKGYLEGKRGLYDSK